MFPYEWNHSYRISFVVMWSLLLIVCPQSVWAHTGQFERTKKKTRSLLKAGASSQWDFLLKWGAASEKVVLKSPGGEEAAACSA